MGKLSYPGYLGGPIWLPRGEKEAPQRVLPDGKVFCVYPKRLDTKTGNFWPNLIGRAGITHLRNECLSDSPADRAKLMVLPGSDAGWPSVGAPAGGVSAPGAPALFSEAQCRRVASIIAPAGLDGDQFGEGGFYIPTESQQAAWYYDERYHICTGSWGMSNYRSMGTYGSLAYYILRIPYWEQPYGSGSMQNPNQAKFRGLYASVAAARNSCSYFQSGNYNVFGANVSWYPFAYGYAQDYYTHAHSMEIMKLGQNTSGATNFCPLFNWGEIEHVVASGYHVATDWQRHTDNPSGIVIDSNEHPQADFDACLAMCFGVGFDRGDGVVQWDRNDVYDTNVNTAKPDQQFTPTVAGQTIPRQNPAYPAYPHARNEAAFVAGELYAQCNRTAGRKFNYLSYQVKRIGEMDFGPIITPAVDGATILDHASAGQVLNGNGTVQKYGGRGDCRGRINAANTAADWYYFNPVLGKHTSEIVRVMHNGRTLENQLQGSKLHVFTD